MESLYSLVMMLALLPGGAQAGDDNKASKSSGEERGRVLMPAKPDPAWVQECGSCHIAYAPGLLPAASWKKIMAGLDQHFGVNATLTDKEQADVTRFLVANASSRWSSISAPLRVTETAWFKRKHRAGEVPAAAWTRASVRGPGNCQACHPGADKGDFQEDAVRIPR